MAGQKVILVMGATGKQGGAVIKALLALPPVSPPIHILAVTRNPESGSAKRLVSGDMASKVTLVTGDLTNPNNIFATQAKGSIDAAFLVTMIGKAEESQGKAFVDAAADHEVKHIVFSSVERGGDEKSWTNPTSIDHFITKHNIELHIRQLAQDKNNSFTWTILRPTAFLDNFEPGMFGKVFVAAWRSRIPATRKIQLVGARDIGLFGAWALTEPDEWGGRAFGLASDEFTLDEAKRTFKEVKGRDLQGSYAFVAQLVMFGVRGFGQLMTWFAEDGFKVDIGKVKEAARAHGAEVQDFARWLREESSWEKDAVSG